MRCDLALDPAEPSTRPLSYSGPIDVLAPSGSQLLSPRWQQRAILAFLVLGILARCLRYALQFPLWEDECFLCINFIDRGFLDLLKPLDCHQTAPVLFLWTELAISRLLGFSELTLRLIPFLASLAGFILFVHIARRLISGSALVVAVGFMAVAYPGIRYAAEAKQYGLDLFMASAFLALAIEWWRQPDRLSWLWILAALAPVAIGMSYPCIFVAGGVAAFIGVVLLAQRRWRCLLPLMVFVLATLATFGALYLVSIRGQNQAEIAYMRGAWGPAFPPALSHPLQLAKWLLLTHTGPLLAVPAGSNDGGSSLTFILCVAGLVVLCRRSLPLVLLALVGPGLQLAAAAVKRYPYGYHVKFSMPFLPFICILAGLGAAALIHWLSRPHHARTVLVVALVLLSLVGIGTMARDIATPYKAKSDQRARAFAQWFWFPGSHSAPVLCAKYDLWLDLTPDQVHDLNWGAMYYCNEVIYNHPGRKYVKPDLIGINNRLPFSVAVYHPYSISRRELLPFDKAAFQEWMDSMQPAFTLASTEVLPMPRLDRKNRKVIAPDFLEVYHFVPKSAQ